MREKGYDVDVEEIKKDIIDIALYVKRRRYYI